MEQAIEGEGCEMKKRKAAGSAYLAGTVVTKHVLALMYDTLRGLRFASAGGGLIGGVQYEDHPMTEADAKVFDRKLEDCTTWLMAALRDVGVTPAKNHMGPKEQALINNKIRIVNRWANARQLRQWTEMVITLAALNLCLLWCRVMKGDTAAIRTFYVKADDLCLCLGGGEEWMMAEDLMDEAGGALLEGLNFGGLRSEEEYFFRFIGLPMARTDMERAVMEDQGRAPAAAQLLAMGAA